MKNIKSNILFLLKYAWKWDKQIFFYFTLFTVITAIIPFIDIFIPKFLIDELTGFKRSGTLIIILASFFIVSSILNYLSSYLNGVSKSKILSIRFKFMNLLQEKSMKMDFKNTEDPNILNNIETATRAISSNIVGIEVVFHKMFQLCGAMITFLGYITIVLTLNPYILLYLLINVYFIYRLTIKAKRYEYSVKDNISEYSRKRDYIYEIMYNFAYGKEIRLLNLNSYLQDKFNLFSNNKLNVEKSIKYKNLRVSIVSILLLLIREGLVYAYLIYNVLQGKMSIGDFTMYFATIAGFAGWMQSILDNISIINAQSLYMNDFRKFIEFDAEEKQENLTCIPKDDTYEIEFKNISFKYPNSERYILKNLSLKIKKGQRLAIVGVNGAGKTTFIKLLTRLYEPTDGEILLNGINISNFDKSEYFKIFSIVFQEIKMFSFSIAENIALVKKEDINKERVIKSLEKVDMIEKIHSLHDGIDTTLLKVLDSNGIELSGGENQKIALARSFYKDGKVIILDEPTAALDPIAEYNTYRNFDDMVENKTAIYISHRLSSTRFCDIIAFFEDGEIKELGTHDELLEKGGKYSEMFNIQASYYKEDSNEGKCVYCEN